jgi:threonine/homoserine/homoserine lactone efflux protein
VIPVDPMTLLSFIPAALALSLTPGAAMMFRLGEEMRSGAKAAIAATSGLERAGWCRPRLWLCRASGAIFTRLALRLALMSRG